MVQIVNNLRILLILLCFIQVCVHYLYTAKKPSVYAGFPKSAKNRRNLQFFCSPICRFPHVHYLYTAFFRSLHFDFLHFSFFTFWFFQKPQNPFSQFFKIDFCKFEIFHFSIFDFFNSHFLENPERSWFKLGGKILRTHTDELIEQGYLKGLELSIKQGV